MMTCATEPAILAREDLRHAAARDRIGRPLERVLADEALGQVERNRASIAVRGHTDWHISHDCTCSWTFASFEFAQLGDGRVGPAHARLRAIRLHPTEHSEGNAMFPVPDFGAICGNFGYCLVNG